MQKYYKYFLKTFIILDPLVVWLERLTRNDMAYFMHLAVWSPKSSLSPNSEELCDVTVECGGRVGV